MATRARCDVRAQMCVGMTMAESANIDQWQNGAVAEGDAITADDAWTNGNVNHTKAHYSEGETVPYRIVFEDLVIGETYTITIVYDTTKGGIEAATRAMAVDMAPWKIRVNVVVPGNITVDNALGGATGPEAAGRTIPLGMPGSPSDIASAAAFLASDDAAYITGQRIVVDGGMDAQLRSPAVDVQIDASGIAGRLE